VKSYLDSPKDDPITLNANFASLSDGVSYLANSVLSAPAKNIQVVVQNSDYQRMAAANPAPAQQPEGTQSATTEGQTAPALSPQQIDSLTAPIALYPDALLAQMLTASTNFLDLQSLQTGWLRIGSHWECATGRCAGGQLRCLFCRARPSRRLYK
jgi:hypothetical protein